MLSWFTGGGGDEKPKSAESQAPGFHPIAVPITNTQAASYVAPTVAGSSLPPPPQVAQAPAAAVFANFNQEAPVVSHSPEAPAAEGLPAAPSVLFDGMAVGKGRRRRLNTSARNGFSCSAALPVGERSPETVASGAATELRYHDSRTPMSATDLRQRLERFYHIYNPSKLSHVEAIMEAYEGREAELFHELVQRYGPEPVGLSASHLHTLPPDAAAQTTTTTAMSARAERALSESEMSAFRFISPTAEAEVTAWALPKTEVDGDDAPQLPSGIQKEKTDKNSPASQPAVLLPSSLTNQEEHVEVIHHDDDHHYDTQQQQQHLLPELSTPSLPPVAQLGPLPSHDELHSATAPAPPRHHFSSSGEEEETTDERRRRELRVSQGNLLAARASFAALLREAQETLQQRHEKVGHIHAVEAQIQACVQVENYREADTLSDDVAQTAREVQSCDAMWAGLGRRISGAQRQLEEAVRTVASLLRTHEVELLSEEEKEQTRVQAQVHRDDSDLRLREERAQVRTEDLAVRRASTEARLRAARASQAEVRTRVEAALGSTRSQHDSLANEVALLDGQINDLKVQLRQLEEKREVARARLAKTVDQLQANTAAHATELNAAAAAVENGEREMRRVMQQCEEVAAEQASIAAERATREAAAAALLEDLKSRQGEREAVHQRTRALERDTIPASDRYWKAWQDLLSKRLHGADVLFEIPAATHPEESAMTSPSALTKKADLQKQLDELAGELYADEKLQCDALRRLAACEARVAPLTAAKAAAVANKNFKAAQQCADELKVIQLSKEGCQDDVDLYGGQVKALERTMERLRGELAAVAAETQRCAAEFMRDYGAAIAAFEASSDKMPDYVQLPKESQGPDELAEAARGLWNTLRQEWARVQESSTTPAVMPPGEEAAAANSPSSVSWASVTGHIAGASVEATAAADAGDGDANAETLKCRLAELQTLLEDAIAREAFGECDTIQQEVTQLETQLASLVEAEGEGEMKEGKLAPPA
jgi:hypothetical protein